MYSKTEYFHGKVVPGEKLCPTCYIRVIQLQNAIVTQSVTEETKEVTASERRSSIAYDALDAGPSQCEPNTNSTSHSLVSKL